MGSHGSILSIRFLVLPGVRVNFVVSHNLICDIVRIDSVSLHNLIVWELTALRVHDGAIMTFFN